MKSRLIARLAVLTLAMSGLFTVSALAQTTEEGPGPSEQPSAPMEIGQSQAGPDQDGQQAQPTEAEPGGPSGEEPAKTDQGVARVSLIHGDVSTQRGDSGDWSAVVLNQPVMTGDKVSTGEGARTELQLDFANTLRLGANSKANIANLTHKDIQIQLSQGIATYSVSKDSEAEPEIDTPNVSVHPSHHDGVFRVEVRPDGDTLVIVRQGEAQISTPQGSTEVRSGEMAVVRGDSSSAQYKISSAPDRDEWDRWISDRDHVIRNANSWRHTNRYYTGAHDLDAYGNWRNVPDYGDVWVPNEPDGWVPYRNGNWVYEPYYGWTWVGYEPWGWAPYHYGRWFWYGSSWAWWPGPVYGGFYRPFWAPAYVSFYGWGSGWGFGFGWGGWGGFGWLPVGPCDYYRPWWGGYRGRFGVINVTNIHVINHFGGIRPLHGGNRFSNTMRISNPHIGRALSTVNASHFGSHMMRPVAVTREQLRGARMMAGNLPVVPSRGSLSASGRAAAPSTIRNGGSERFFGSVHNNMARPLSFQQQTASLRQTMRQNHVGAIPAGGRSNGEFGARGTGPASTMQRPVAGTFSNRQMNNPGNRNVGNMPSSTQNGNRGGFRPFTPPNNSNRSSGAVTTERPNMGTPNSGRPNVESPRGTIRAPESINRGSVPSGNRDGFRPFTPPSRSDMSRGVANAPSTRGSSGNYWNRTAPSSPITSPSRSDMSRGVTNAPSTRGNSGTYWNRTSPSTMPGTQMHVNGPVYGGSERSSSRPQLDMRQPIVRSPSYGGGYSGGSRGPSYSAPRSAPSYGGSHGSPSFGGSRPSGGGGGGGHVSAPSGGGRSSGGGGGGHSSGGGHTSGGRR